MNIIAWLRTPIATLIVLCAALLAQLPHAADVFRLIVAGTGWPAVLHGYAYAIALELAVLLFVVQKRDLESYMFAGVSILVNLSYYSLHGINLFSVAALPAWLVSIALPAAIARYSHLLVEESPEQEKPTSEEKPQKAEKTKNRARENNQAPVALPVGTLGHSDVSPAPAAPAAEAADQPQVPDAKPRRLTEAEKQTIINMKANGMKSVDIADQMQLNENTVRSIIARASKPAVHTNGVTKENAHL